MRFPGFPANTHPLQSKREHGPGLVYSNCIFCLSAESPIGFLWELTGGGEDFTFSLEESVGWTNFLYSTLEPLV